MKNSENCSIIKTSWSPGGMDNNFLYVLVYLYIFFGNFLYFLICTISLRAWLCRPVRVWSGRQFLLDYGLGRLGSGFRWVRSGRDVQGNHRQIWDKSIKALSTPSASEIQFNVNTMLTQLNVIQIWSDQCLTLSWSIGSYYPSSNSSDMLLDTSTRIHTSTHIQLELYFWADRQPTLTDDGLTKRRTSGKQNKRCKMYSNTHEEQ